MTFALQATATGRGADRLSPVVHIQTDGIRRAKLIHGFTGLSRFQASLQYFIVLKWTMNSTVLYCTVAH